MTDDGGEDTAGGDGSRPLGRRGLLGLSAAGLATLAGCGAGDDGGDGAGDGGSSTADPTTTDPTSTTAPPTATATTAAAPDTTAQTRTERTTAPPTTVGYDADPVIAPSSAIAPTDGFADADWLATTAPDIVRVTSLDASGAGTLRAALEASGPRIVVFEVGGVIDLAGDGGLEIPPGHGDVFVAGQTAPDPGITIVRGDLVANAENVVIQHLRVRPGDELPGPTDGLSAGERGVNVIVDHCSASWATDEVMSSGGSESNRRVTFANNVVAECLSSSIHPKGEHSKGSLVMDDATEVALLGNFLAKNRARNPRLKGGTTSVVANNVVFEYSQAVTIGGGSETPAETAVVGNVWSHGPDKRIVEEASEYLPVAYAADNEVFYYDEHGGTFGAPIVGENIEEPDEATVWPAGFEALPWADARRNVLDSVGARPANRAAHDRRVIDQFRATLEDMYRQDPADVGYVDSQSEVGGYPELETTERSLDPPAAGDGLGSWLAAHTRAVETGTAPPGGTTSGQ